MLQSVAMESASVAASLLNTTAGMAVQGVVEAAKRKMNINVEGTQPHISAAEWFRELLGKKEWRIPCIDVAVRL